MNSDLRGTLRTQNRRKAIAYPSPLLLLVRMYVMRKPFPDYGQDLKGKKPHSHPRDYAVSPSEWAKLSTWQMFLVGHSWSPECVPCPLVRAPRHNTSSPSCHLPGLVLDPSLSCNIAIPVWSPHPHNASSTPTSMPPLDWSSQNACLVMSPLSHLEMRKGKGCFRRAAPAVSSSPPVFLQQSQIPWKQVTERHDSWVLPGQRHRFTLSIVACDGLMKPPGD